MERKFEKPSQVVLTYVNQIPPSKRVKTVSSSDSYGILLQCYNPQTIEHHMEVKALLLNRASEVLGVIDVGSGGNVDSPIDTKAVFQAVLLSNASGVIIARNTPSGLRSASMQDIAIADHCGKLCKLLDILLLDYLIIDGNQFYSFVDEGRL